MEKNTYYVEDNLVLLKKVEKESVDLIYFDPPYNTGRDFYNFNDKFESVDAYSDFIKLRIIECRRILKKTGTMIVHIEPRVSPYFRLIADSLFGLNNFKNEIVWKTGGNSKNIRQLNRWHDTILVYAKNKGKQLFNPIYFPYDDAYKKNAKICPIHKKLYKTTAIHNSQPEVNPRMNLRYEWQGNTRQWYVCKEKMEELHKDNRLQYNNKNIPRIKRFLDEMDGIPLRDIWDDIANIQSKEKLKYATQKPVKLLERIVTLYSDEKSLCLDIFAGSGTLGRACKNLKSHYFQYPMD